MTSCRTALLEGLRWLKHTPDRIRHPARRKAARARQRRHGVPDAVLVVCHGNICRSPYAAAALRTALAERTGRAARVESAGFIGAGRPCPRVALAEALGRGANLAVHRSRPLTPESVARADLLIVMDARQARSIWERFGRSDALVLGDLDPGRPATRGIADPVNGTRATFAACYERIDRCVRGLVDAIAAHEGEGADAASQRGAPDLVTVPLRETSGAGPAPRLTLGSRIAHHFTVDLEEYFHVAALEACVPVSSWSRMESRVGRSTSMLLELLEAYGARATFFVLGWVAERHPDLIRAIAAAGHEIASHGLAHRRVSSLGREELRARVRNCRDLLQDLTGTEVVGFRAPNFSIVPGCEWALDVLIEEGYRYDSSIYPIRRPGYGYPGARRGPHWIERPAGRILEFPPATLRKPGLTLPAGGGAYFRLLPYSLAAAALREWERLGQPATFYIHPWELDADQPRLTSSWTKRFRHYGGLARMRKRLERLLGEFRFVSIDETLARHDTLDLVRYAPARPGAGNGVAAVR